MFQLIEVPLSFCIGCGCDDHHACTNPADGQPCAWLAVDRARNVGVCSACSVFLNDWKAGRRHLSTLALVRRHRNHPEASGL